MYSQFCLHYYEYRPRLARLLGQTHGARERCLSTAVASLSVIDPKVGEIRIVESIHSADDLMWEAAFGVPNCGP
jgi:hypothetical protein